MVEIGNVEMLTRFRTAIVFLCDSVILIGIVLILSEFSLSYGITDAIGQGQLIPHLALLYICTVAFQVLFHTYDSLWRYAESREYLFLLIAAICGFATYEIINRFVFQTGVISFMLLTATASLWVLGMLFVRFAYRVYRSHVLNRKGAHRRPVAIIGAGNAGVQLLQEIQNDSDSRYSVQCFFDDDPAKVGKRVRNVVVRGTVREAPKILNGMDIHEVIVAIPSISEHRRHEILQELSQLDRVKISILPNTLELIGEKAIGTQLREVSIEDLLGREPVQLNNAQVDAFLGEQVVLVSGGGGSIGSELCRQIAKHCPKQLIVVDIYENNAYDIQQELRLQYGAKLNLAVEIASIRDRERMRRIFECYRPNVVFHAAAHKHVPLMESSPQEAIRNNVFGTWNLVCAADEFGVEKFVQISTDKAVNPTSVMGASKRLCEMTLQSMKGRSKTVFAAVRFGNVLGSNGSVVPLFKRQIAAGGPVTITDKRIIRYFMTIPEAAQLVLQAGALARQNELYVLDMGQPVKILDLAENLIRLSGYLPYQDIDIKEVGLRPGEKLYEELLIKSRDIERTENDKIFVERQPAITAEEMQEKFDILHEALAGSEPAAIRAALHRVVPTFREP